MKRLNVQTKCHKKTFHSKINSDEDECLPEHKLDNVLIRIVLCIVESCVSAGVNAVDDRLHAVLHQHVVVAEQGVDGLLVHMPALIPVHQDLTMRVKSTKMDDVIRNLVVVSGLQHHVKNCLVEFVLYEEVCVKESFEHLKKKKV